MRRKALLPSLRSNPLKPAMLDSVKQMWIRNGSDPSRSWNTAILLVQYSKSRVNNYFCLYSHFSRTYKGSVDVELDKPGCS